MKVKRLFLGFLTLLLCVTLGSCSPKENGNNEENNNNNSGNTETTKEYSIEFVVNGKVIKNDTVKENETATYSGETPTKESTAEYDYVFDSWVPSLGKVTKDMTYVASFKEVKRKYNISFYDEEGKLLSKEKFAYGSTPNYNYQKEDTNEFDYEVLGFSSTLGGQVLTTLPSVTKDASYYAVISKKVKEYKITLDLAGGSGETKLIKKYGDIITELPKPKKDGHVFVCYTTDPLYQNKVELPYTVTKDTTFYAKYNEKVPVLNYLKSLLSSYNQNPYNYIPDTMRFDYSPNLTEENLVKHDYSNFVKFDKIIDGGFGEQWAMISDNLRQSKRFYDILNIVQTLRKTSVVLFERYLDENPGDTADFTHKDGIYTITIKFENNVISYGVSYTGNVPLFGNQDISIMLAANINTNEKISKIKIGEENQLKYTIKDNLYSFGITYLGLRTAYFDIKTINKNNYVGHIYEFIHKDKLVISSAAEFYIDENYVKAVGNKASAMMGWNGIINELYDVKTGKILGYEVKESISKIEYHTLWLNISEFMGIDNIKATENKVEEANPNLIYINNSSDPFATKKVGGISAQTLSRRYDIELRDETKYSYNTETKEFDEIKYKVPKVFVQENFYNSLSKDVLEKNPYLKSFIYVPSSDKIAQIIEDHKTLVPIFEANKDSVTVEQIQNFIKH